MIWFLDTIVFCVVWGLALAIAAIPVSVGVYFVASSIHRAKHEAQKQAISEQAEAIEKFIGFRQKLSELEDSEK